MNNFLVFIGYFFVFMVGLFLFNWFLFLCYGKVNYSKFYNMYNICGMFFIEVKCDLKYKYELIKRWYFLRNELVFVDMMFLF